MILVTGATGHIGNVLTRELAARGESVRVLVLPGEDRAAVDGLPVEIAEGDVLDPAAVEQAMAGVEVVYHLAGIISILPGQQPLVRRVNVEGTRNILAAARRAGVRRLVYTSSIHAIARVAPGILIDEKLPFDPNNNVGEYDRSKAQASLAVLEAARDGLDAVIVCPTGVIGPHDYRLSETGRLLLQGVQRQVSLCIEGAYDFVDVRDVALGQILACERGRSGEVYILSGEVARLADLVRLAAEIAGHAARVILIPLQVARLVADIMPLYYRLTRSRPIFTSYSLVTVTGNCEICCDKARRELGYAPRALSQTVADTVTWLQAYRAKAGKGWQGR